MTKKLTSKLKPYGVIMGVIVALSGCASIAGAPTNSVADKTAGSMCATSGAALQSMVVAGAIKALEKVKPEAEVMHTVCNETSPAAAITMGETKAYEAIIDAAAPYMGD